MRYFAVWGGVMLIALLVAACSGSSGDEDIPGGIVRDALLEVSDLPDDDWDVSDIAVPLDAGNASDAASALVVSAPCMNIRQAIETGSAAKSDRDESPVAAGEREFRGGGGLDLVVVSSTVRVYETARGADADLDELRDAWRAPEGQQCLQDAFASFASPADSGTELEAIEAVDFEPPVSGSFAFGARISALIAGAPNSIRITTVLIARGNAVGGVQIFEVNDSEVDMRVLAEVAARKLEQAQ